MGNWNFPAHTQRIEAMDQAFDPTLNFSEIIQNATVVKAIADGLRLNPENLMVRDERKTLVFDAGYSTVADGVISKFAEINSIKDEDGKSFSREIWNVVSR